MQRRQRNKIPLASTVAAHNHAIERCPKFAAKEAKKKYASHLTIDFANIVKNT